MIERCQELGLALKPGHALRIAAEHLRQHLDGDLAVEVRVLGAIDDAHASRAELFCDAVVGKGCADHGAGSLGRGKEKNIAKIT